MVDVLLANAERVGTAEPDMPVGELLATVVGEPDVAPVDAVDMLVQALRQASDLLAQQAEEIEQLRKGPTGGVRLGIGFTHNPDGSPRGGHGGDGGRYRRRIG